MPKVKIVSIPMGGGGKVKSPIYTSNKNDPRLKAYNDSLNLHDIAQKFIRQSTGILYDDHDIYTNENDRSYYPDYNPNNASEQGKIEVEGLKDVINNKYYKNIDKKNAKNILQLYNRTHIEPIGVYKARVDAAPAFKRPVQPVLYKPNDDIISTQQLNPQQVQVPNLPPIVGNKEWYSNNQNIPVDSEDVSELYNEDGTRKYQHGGQVMKQRVRIVEVPAMAYGGNIPGTYNQFDAHSWNPNTYQAMLGVNPKPDPYARTGRTLPEAEPGEGDLTWEKDEVMLANVDGMPATFVANAGTHASGNDKTVKVPGNTEDNPAFIFSDTSSLKIRNPEILKLFEQSKSATPAKIATKYNLQRYTKTIADPDSDPVSRKTAEMMVANYTDKLGKLANVQENMKMQQGIVPPEQQSQHMATGGRFRFDGDSPEENNYIPYVNSFPQDNYTFSAKRPVQESMMPTILGMPYTPPQPTNMQAANVPDISGNNFASSAPSGNKYTNMPFTAPTPDKMGIADSIMNLASIHRYPAWEAPINATTPSVTYVDPTRALAANSEAANAQSYNNALSGNSRAARASSAGVQGQAASQAADIVGKYANENVSIANRANENSTAIMNRLQEMQAQRSNRLYQGNITSAQQYENAIREGRNDLTKQYQNAWNDRQKYDLLNKTSPYFYLDPKTGQRVFKSAEAEAAFNNQVLGRGAGYSPDVAEKVNGIYEKLLKQPAYQTEHGKKLALQLAQRMAGVTEHESIDYGTVGSPAKTRESGVYSGPQERYGGKIKRMGGMTNHQLSKFISKRLGGTV